MKMKPEQQWQTENNAINFTKLKNSANFLYNNKKSIEYCGVVL